MFEESEFLGRPPEFFPAIRLTHVGVPQEVGQIIGGCKFAVAQNLAALQIVGNRCRSPFIENHPAGTGLNRLPNNASQQVGRIFVTVPAAPAFGGIVVFPIGCGDDNPVFLHVDGFLAVLPPAGDFQNPSWPGPRSWDDTYATAATRGGRCSGDTPSVAGRSLDTAWRYSLRRKCPTAE